MIGDILQPTHLLFILVIALLVLGPKRLPEVGRSLGRGMRDFRNAISGDDHHDEIAADSGAPSVPSHDAVAEPDTGPEPEAEAEPSVAAEPAVAPEPAAVAAPAAGPEPRASQEPDAEPAERLG